MILTTIKASLTYVGSTDTRVTVRYGANYPSSNGASVFTPAYLTVPALTKSATAVAGGVLTTTVLPNDSEILVGVSIAGTDAAGLKVYLIGNKS